jgi:hypothetical protein
MSDMMIWTTVWSVRVSYCGPRRHRNTTHVGESPLWFKVLDAAFLRMESFVNPYMGKLSGAA